MGPEKLALRDIHMPDPVSWWPPATGWWILLATTVMLVIGGWLLWRRHRRRRHRIRAVAQRELERLYSDFSRHRSAHYLIRDLSVWLRRTCISLYPRRESASLTGNAWLRFLDEAAGKPHFATKRGKVLVDAPYMRHAEIQADDVLRLCQDWLRALPEQSPGERS